MRSLVWGLCLLFSFSSYALKCGKDRKQFCPQAEVGKAELINCLSQNEKKLGLQCRASLVAFKEKQKKNPCHEDISKLCSDMPLTDQPLMVCLTKNEAKLSPACAADYKKKKDTFIAKEACAQDLMTKCYDALAKGTPQTNRCLIKNKGKLMARCETAIGTLMQKMRSKNPCFDDTEKLCPSVFTPGEIDGCLIGKMASLAPTCKAKMEAEAKKLAADPCRGDIRTFCKPKTKGKRSTPKELYACLSANEAKLSRACVSFRQTKRTQIEHMQTACEADRKKFCSKVLPMGGKIVECLNRNRAQLSRNCAAQL